MIKTNEQQKTRKKLSNSLIYQDDSRGIFLRERETEEKRKKIERDKMREIRRN